MTTPAEPDDNTEFVTRNGAHEHRYKNGPLIRWTNVNSCTLEEFKRQCQTGEKPPTDLERRLSAALAENAKLIASENDQLAAIDDLTHDIRIDADTPDSMGDVVERVKCLLAQVEALRREKALLPADWMKDSSLETWFPYSAQELADRREDSALLDHLDSSLNQLAIFGNFVMGGEKQSSRAAIRRHMEHCKRAAIDSAQRQEGR